jgi:diguanylate cyclase
MSLGSTATIDNKNSGPGQLADLESAGNIISAGEKMVASVGRVEAVLNSANQDASAYHRALADFGGEISQGSSDDMQALVARMMQQTQDMQKQNDLLRAQLEHSSGEIDKLRCNLVEVQNDAMTDGLTRVGNRKCFDFKLQQMAEHARDEGHSLCLMLFDVDHFKAFNDAHGHPMGDQVLRLVARTLQQSVKGRDVVARYGGEEFAVILAGARLADAIKVGDGIRDNVAKRRIVRKNTGEELAAITISAGVAAYRPGEPLSDLIERSDEALYRAKDGGRNLVMPETAAPARVAVKG